MVSGGLRLGQVEPRERAGAQTGRKYEYQYERTARATLDLLADTAKHVCVYCDWHDDYVVEIGDSPTRYVFHQVKGRKSSQGPWTFSEFFGVLMKKAKKPSKNPATVKLDAVVPRMVLHHTNFSDNCAGVAFVTNAGIDTVLSEFLEAIGRSADAAALPDVARIAFEHLARAYIAADPPLAPSAIGITGERLDSILKSFHRAHPSRMISLDDFMSMNGSRFNTDAIRALIKERFNGVAEAAMHRFREGDYGKTSEGGSH